MDEFLQQKLEDREKALHFTESIIATVSNPLIVLDYSLKLTFANKAFYKTFKVNPGESIGQFIYDLGNSQWNIPKMRLLLEDILPKLSILDNFEVEHNFEIIGRRTMLLNARRIDTLQLILLEIEDITDRKLAEEKIKSLLEEKKILLKEVHHRIKNNMNSISSLLMLQADSLKNEEAINALNDAQSRILTMNILYDKLYRSDNFNEVSLKEYLDTLVSEVLSVLPSTSHILIEKHIDEITISAKNSLSIGILITELLTNIHKYAFTGRDKGKVTISASKKDDKVVITIQDDGVGIPESVNIQNSTGFGLKLVNMMATNIEGTIWVERNNGTKFTLEIPL